MKKIVAKFKYVKISPFKLRRIVNLVRGKECNQAIALLKSLPHKASRIVQKIIRSAMASAKSNYQCDPNKLQIIEILADGAGMLKRFRAKSRGRAGPVKKRMSHLTIGVASIGGET